MTGILWASVALAVAMVTLLLCLALGKAAWVAGIGVFAAMAAVFTATAIARADDVTPNATEQFQR